MTTQSTMVVSQIKRVNSWWDSPNPDFWVGEEDDETMDRWDFKGGLGAS